MPGELLVLKPDQIADPGTVLAAPEVNDADPPVVDKRADLGEAIRARFTGRGVDATTAVLLAVNAVTVIQLALEEWLDRDDRTLFEVMLETRVPAGDAGHLPALPDRTGVTAASGLAASGHGNRHSPRMTGAESVLIPRPQEVS